ncbi:hypothetical protein BJX65DRAFT_85994 [Aspergillus insuetus]
MKMLLNAGADGNAALCITARNQATSTLIEAMRECGITVTEPAQSELSSPSAAGDTDTRKRSRGSRSAFYNYGTVGNVEPADDDGGNDHRSVGGVFVNHGYVANQSRGAQNLQGRTWNFGSQSLQPEDLQGRTSNTGSQSAVSAPAAAANDRGTQGTQTTTQNFSGTYNTPFNSNTKRG